MAITLGVMPKKSASKEQLQQLAEVLQALSTESADGERKKSGKQSPQLASLVNGDWSPMHLRFSDEQSAREIKRLVLAVRDLPGFDFIERNGIPIDLMRKKI